MRACIWWIPVTAVAAYAAKKIYDKRKAKRTSASAAHRAEPANESPLTYNLARLRRELSALSGKRKIAVLGQPGAGKSSLLDALTDEKLEPRPLIGSTTDVTDWSQDWNTPLCGIYQSTVYVDVPGHGTMAHPAEAIVRQFPFELFDKILFVIRGKVMEADEQVWERIKSIGLMNRTLVVRSFAESLSKAESEKVCQDIRLHLTGSEPILLSNRTGQGMAEVRAFLNKQ